ncbi:MAG: hypothetical protein U0S49_04685 [Rhodospirillales bacterium]|nr:hypothetical protein [Rhodospirillales bacterium]
MLISLVVTFLLAFFAGAMVWLAYRTFRRKPPPFLIPAVIGATMIAFTTWTDYTWAARTTDALPAGVEVVERIEGGTPWQPWTLLFPRADRMVAIDRAGILKNERFPDHSLVELVLLERFMPARLTRVIIDCRGARQASAGAGALDAAAVEAASWAPMRRDGPLFRTVCASPASSPAAPD